MCGGRAHQPWLWLLSVVSIVAPMRSVPIVVSAEPHWARAFSGRAGGDWPGSVLETRDGGYLVVGTTYLSKDPDDDFVSGVFCAKLDRDGNPIWQRIFHGHAHEEALDASEASDGTVLVVGHSTSMETERQYGLCLKLNGEGDIVWANLYGGTDEEEFTAVASTPDGGCVISGSRYAERDPEGGGSDGLILKLDEMGKIEWQIGIGSDDREYLSGVGSLADGYIVSGGTDYTTDTVTPSQGWIVRLNLTGELSWTRTYGVPGALHDFTSIALHPSGGFIAGGLADHKRRGWTMWCTRLDNAGGIVWSRVFGRYQFAADGIVMGSNGHSLLLGTNSAGEYASQAGWVAEVDGSGELVRQKKYKGYYRVRAGTSTTDGGYVITANGWSRSIHVAKVSAQLSVCPRIDRDTVVRPVPYYPEVSEPTLRFYVTRMKMRPASDHPITKSLQAYDLCELGSSSRHDTREHRGMSPVPCSERRVRRHGGIP